MADIYLRKYGVAVDIDIDLYSTNGVDLKVDATFAAGDVKVRKDNGAEANIGTLPTDRGNTYSQPLAIAELQAARTIITYIDQTAPKAWMDKAVIVETYGHASAQHAFDLDTALTPTTIWDRVLIGTKTAKQILGVLLPAFAAGKVTGAGTTTITFRDTEDGFDAIVMTVDGSGNRSSVTINFS